MKSQESIPETDRLIGSKEIRQIVPYTIYHLSRLEAKGQFPRRVKVGAGRQGRIGWPSREVEQWVEARKASRQGKARK